jgi:hypothetical protein
MHAVDVLFCQLERCELAFTIYDVNLQHHCRITAEYS